MQSSIGQHFKSPQARRFAVLLGLATIATDMALVTQRANYDTRLALALAAFATIVFLTDGDLRSVGLRLNPKQGWRPWVHWSVMIGLVVALCLVLGLGIWRLTGHEIRIHTTSPTHIVPRMLSMCFVAPMMEETVYRVVACVSLVSVLGCWKTIVINGLLFAALHVLYGSPSPENLVGGFFLAWAYLKSESILLPVLLHSIGNSIALAGQVAEWYIVNQPGTFV